MKKLILVFLMTVCSVCVFAADKVAWKKFCTNDKGAEFYYNVYQKNEWYDEETVFENTDGDYELIEDIGLSICDEFTQKVVLKCVEHGRIVVKYDGSFSDIYYLGHKTDIYGNKYYTFALTGRLVWRWE